MGDIFSDACDGWGGGSVVGLKGVGRGGGGVGGPRDVACAEGTERDAVEL